METIMSDIEKLNDDRFAQWGIDFLEPPAIGRPGRIGMTSLPAGPETIKKLRDEFGMNRLVSLVEAKHQATAIWNWCAEARVLHHWYPIPDMKVPRDMEHFGELVAEMVEAMDAGETVVIHCFAGLGRSGLLAACILVALGKAPADAIRLVREVRKQAIQTDGQEKFIKSFKTAWAWR